MSVPYPVIPAIKDLKDAKVALDNIRSYFKSLFAESQLAEDPQRTTTTYKQIQGIDLSTGNLVLANRTTIELLEVTTGHVTNAIIAPNTPGKLFTVANNDAVNSVTIKVNGGTGVTIAPSNRRQVVCNGTDYDFAIIPDPTGNVQNIVMSLGDDTEGSEESFPVPPGLPGVQGEKGSIGPPGKDGEDGEDGYFIIKVEDGVGQFRYAAALADTGEITLPTITGNWPAHGFIHCAHASSGAISDSAEFEYGSDGVVSLIRGTANIEANGATAGKISIGAAVSANPVVIKNNLGGGTSKNVMITLWYN